MKFLKFNKMLMIQYKLSTNSFYVLFFILYFIIKFYFLLENIIGRRAFNSSNSLFYDSTGKVVYTAGFLFINSIKKKIFIFNKKIGCNFIISDFP